MNLVSKTPESMCSDFISRLKHVCSTGTTLLNVGTDIVVSEKEKTSNEQHSCILTNVAKDVTLDIIFSPTNAVIIFNRYRINPFQLHKGCKLMSGDNVYLSLSIPVSTSERLMDNTLSYISELVHECFDYKKFA